jgi:eukaryotic-like serine/threonine-protein kinase
MALASGTRLGPYEIVSPIGAGGMGEVYRARDTRLERTVAIKVLAERLGADPQFAERFGREARAISQLDHPHICALYDIGTQNGIAYLVMAYLEGETLDSRLKGGALPINEAIRIAIQIADALDKAHRSGIVHRDLKPGNIFLTRSGAKLLDFGLAKTVGPSARESQVGVSTTEQLESTAQGTILGTVQYMAPEQIEATHVDARTDLFAFGAVLYEVLTGRKAFEGKSQPSLMGAILKDEPPPVSQVQPLVSPLLDHVVRTCLAKHPDDRFQTAHDLLLQLRWIAEGGSAVGAPAVAVARRKRRERLLGVGLAVAVLLWLATLVPASLYFWRPAEVRPVEFAVATPDMSSLLLLAVSPDGRLITFAAPSASGSRNVLWLRPLSSNLAQPVAGTEGAFAPFWSPDSQYIGFVADGQVKKVSVTGGSPQTLFASQTFANGTWNREGVILFSNGNVLQRVSAAGGEPVAVTTLDKAQQETVHRWPYFLPDGRHFLYSTWSLQPDKRAIVIGSLDSSERTRLISAESMAVYASPGFLIFQRAGTLFAQPFDAKRMRMTGEPVRLAEDVAYVPRSGRAAFDVSQTGVLVYRTGQPTRPTYALSWFHRSGKPLGTAGAPGPYNQIRLSADDNQVAIERMDPKTGTLDIWILELSNNILTRLTFDPAYDQDPTWSHDGRSMVYASQRMGKYDFFQKTVRGTAESLLHESDGQPQYPDDLSRDSRFLLYHTETVMYALPLKGDRKPMTLDRTPFKKDQARFSPDGQWVTYESGESGTTEVYVASFPAFDNRRQLTARGGAQPQWRSDGRELFYLTLDGKLMAMSVKPGPSIEFGVPRMLFQTPLVGNTCCLDLYGVTRDGERFLFPVLQPSKETLRPITVVVNWSTRMKTQ